MNQIFCGFLLAYSIYWTQFSQFHTHLICYSIRIKGIQIWFCEKKNVIANFKLIYYCGFLAVQWSGMAAVIGAEGTNDILMLIYSFIYLLMTNIHGSANIAKVSSLGHLLKYWFCKKNRIFFLLIWYKQVQIQFKVALNVFLFGKPHFPATYCADAVISGIRANPPTENLIIFHFTHSPKI